MSIGTALSNAIVQYLGPLRLALTDHRHLQYLLESLGWTLDELSADDLGVFGTLLPVASDVEAFVTTLVAVQNGDEEVGSLVEDGLALAQGVVEAIAALGSLDAGDLSTLPAPLDDPSTWAEVALDLPEYLLLEWLDTHQPAVLGIAQLAGAVVEVERSDERVSRYEIDWVALGNLLRDPPQHLAETYGWDASFDHARLLRALAKVMDGFGLAPRLAPVRHLLGTTYFGGAYAPHDVRELTLPIHEGESNDGSAVFTLGLLVLPVPETGFGEPDGILLSHELAGEASGSLGLSDDWTLSFHGAADATGALGVTFHPSGVALATGDAGVDLGLSLVGAPTSPWILLGDEGGTRLELAQIETEIAIAGTVGEPELKIGAALSGFDLIIDPGEGDSFLADVLGGQELRVTSDLRASWSSVDGLAVAGGVGFDVALPLDLVLGPITVSTLGIRIEGGGDGVSAELSVTGGLELGPFSATIEGIGAEVIVGARDRGDHSGTLGSVDVRAGLRPPDGLGLSIEAPVVSGGGYLFMDRDAGEYAGILDLDLMSVGITAIGMLTTELPDGADGWSLFLSLAATFEGIQLGFGFTLEGVGGIVGINRGLDQKALADAVRSGSLDSVLFPEDPIANAPKILSDLGAIFPVAVGQHVFGPVARIGWGTPKLVNVDLGIVFQFPDPFTISLLGALEALLPDPEAPVLELHVDFAGTLDFTAGTLAFDASLNGSKVAGMLLTGDLAVRAAFRDRPSFLMAFGGFHPAFEPPADFPTLARLGIAIDAGDKLRVGLGGYFALTSNTVQFGAAMELWASAAGFTVEGGCTFDALIQFKPFSFAVGIRIWLSVRAGSFDLVGVDLSGELQGPNPWHIAGRATFKILGIKTSFELEATFGRALEEAPTEAVDVGALLVAEVGRADAWSAVEPDGDGAAVLVSEPSSASGDLFVHPMGRIEVGQRLVPLDVEIECYGAAKVLGASELSITPLRIGEIELDPDAAEATRDWFATAQYFELSDDEKLAAPSFDELGAGVRIGGDGLEAAAPKTMVFDYEVGYQDDAVPHTSDGGLASGTDLALARAITLGDALRARDASRLPRSTALGSPFSVSPVGYVVSSTTTAAQETGIVASETDFFGARKAARDAAQTDNWAVVPGYELEMNG